MSEGAVGIGTRLAQLEESVRRSEDKLEALYRNIETLKSDLSARETVDKALKETFRAAAAKQVTTRQFYLGIAGFLLAVIGLYLGAQ